MAGTKRNRSKARESQQRRTGASSAAASASRPARRAGPRPRRRLCPVCHEPLPENTRADAAFNSGACRAAGHRGAGPQLRLLARQLREAGR